MNWDLILTAVIASIAPTVAALAAWHQSQETHKAVNSRMSELLELARAEAGATATLVEKEAEHLRKGEAAVIEVETKLKGELP